MKLLSLLAVAALLFQSPLLACEKDHCDGEHAFLASCEGGKCPKEMIKRAREQKRMQAAPVDGDETDEEEEVEYDDEIEDEEAPSVV